MKFQVVEEKSRQILAQGNFFTQTAVINYNCIKVIIITNIAIKS